MKTTSLITVLLSILGATLSQEIVPRFRSDYTFVSEATGWFKEHWIPASWDEARFRCSLEGAVLASPINNEIQSAIKNLINKKPVPPTIWTGIRAIFSKRYFTSVEGIPVTAMDDKLWKNYYFLNSVLSNGPDCISYDIKYFINKTEEQLIGLNCIEAKPFLCFRKFTHFNITECGTIDKEYTFEPKTGSCYKYHSDKRDWFAAYLTCEAEGGYLAIMNSREEADLLTLKMEDPKAPHIGITLYNNGQVLTIHGETLKEAGYENFENQYMGQYMGPSIPVYCGVMDRRAVLDVNICETVRPFICEKDPKSLRP